MKPSRCIAFTAGVFILVTGIVMTILSTLSLFAYNCYFHDIFTQSPEGYMFHLFYYRSHHCNAFVDWSIIVENMTSFVEPQIPHETEVVTRTFWFAFAYIIFNGLLIVVSINMMVATKRHWVCQNRHLTYQLTFVPLSIIFFGVVWLDMTAGWFFSFDRFRSNSIDGTMTMLEVANRLEARSVIEQIDPAARALPATIMIFVAMKGIAGQVINILVLFFITLTGWEVVDGNKRHAAVEYITNDEKKRTSL